MGLLSTIAKLGAIGAAPFTGGASLAALPIIQGIGGALGAGGAAAKGGRLADADLQARMDALNNRTQLDAANHNLTTGAARLGQVQRADVASNMHDAAPTGDPRIDKFGGGGLRPSAFGPDSMTAANEQKRQALSALMSGSDQMHPAVSKIPEAGFMEKLGGVGGLVGGIAGAGSSILDSLNRTPIMYGQTGQPTGAPNLGYQPLKKAKLVTDDDYNAGAL